MVLWFACLLGATRGVVVCTSTLDDPWCNGLHVYLGGRVVLWFARLLGRARGVMVSTSTSLKAVLNWKRTRAFSRAQQAPLFLN